MEIIELTSENIEQYVEGCLETQAHLVSDSSTITAELFQKAAADEAGYLITIIDNGRVMGLGIVNRISHPANVTGYINNIVVHPDARGKGLFKVIMNELERYAFEEWGCTDIALTCSREPVQMMYERRGYKAKDTKFYLLQK